MNEQVERNNKKHRENEWGRTWANYKKEMIKQEGSKRKKNEVYMTGIIKTQKHR